VPTAFGRTCSVRAYYTHVVGLAPFVPTAFGRACLLFDGELSQEVGRGVGSCLQRVAELCFRAFQT